jgi:lipopolysaccharide biosynthesis glycosyltransferase
MLINKNLWISNKVSALVLNYTSCFHNFVFLWDQYGLNIVLNEKWKPLEMRWNEVREIIYGETVFRHYIKVKPTIYSYGSADKDVFYYYLDLALGKKWRPSFFIYLISKLINKLKNITN